MKSFKNFKIVKLIIFSLLILSLTSCPSANTPSEPTVVTDPVLNGAFGETNTSVYSDTVLNTLDVTSTKSFAYPIWILEVTDRTTREKAKYYVEWQRYLKVESDEIADPNSEQGELYEKIRKDLWKAFLIGTWEDYYISIDTGKEYKTLGRSEIIYSEDQYTEEELKEVNGLKFSTNKVTVPDSYGDKGTWGANTYEMAATGGIAPNYFRNFTFSDGYLRTNYMSLTLRKVIN